MLASLTIQPFKTRYQETAAAAPRTWAGYRAKLAFEDGRKHYNGYGKSPLGALRRLRSKITVRPGFWKEPAAVRNLACFMAGFRDRLNYGNLNGAADTILSGMISKRSGMTPANVKNYKRGWSYCNSQVKKYVQE